MKSVLAIAIVLIVLLAGRMEAQEAAAPAIPDVAVPVLPPAVPAFALPAQAIGAGLTTTLSFGNLVPAKIDINGDRKQVIMMVEGFRTEKGTANRVSMGEEKRTRKITRPDGGVEEQEYTVQVPVQSVVEQDVLVPVGLKPKIMSLEDFKFFDLDSKVVSHEDAAKTLSTLRPVFLYEQFAGEPPAIGQYEKQVLKPDVLIAVTTKVVRARRNYTLMMHVTPRIIIPEEEEARP